MKLSVASMLSMIKSGELRNDTQNHATAALIGSYFALYYTPRHRPTR